MKKSITPFKACFLTAKTAFFLIVFALSAHNTNAQDPCGTNKGPNPLYQKACRATLNGSHNRDMMQRLQHLGGPGTAAMKHKYRSLLVGASFNGSGNFAIADAEDDSINFTAKFDPNHVSIRLGIDEDSNCIYEREDEFLNWVVENQYDEIILNGIQPMLRFGKFNLLSYEYSSQSSKGPYSNIMGEKETVEWHLARFIYKAKTDFNLKVVGQMSRKLEESDLDNFYDYHQSYSRSYTPFLNIDSLLNLFSEAFFQQYATLWLLYPEEVTYKNYGEDTLFLPKDDDDRISDIDKFIVDVYNLMVFNHRVSNNYIVSVYDETYDNDQCGSLPDEEDTDCLKGFDAHILEWEWWDYSNPTTLEDEFVGCIGALNRIRAKFNALNFNCVPELYVFQNGFGDALNYTPQQRADSIDKYADRIYLYSYHKNPCDCYNGTGTDSLSANKFWKKVAFFANNGFGANNGHSVILPVFNTKYIDVDKHTLPRPVFYNDGNLGCDPEPGQQLNSRNCDFCQNYVGHALNKLDTAESITTGGIYGKNIGYIENLFQDQYDLDSNTHYPSNSDNIIYGYAWFKFSGLFFNDFVNSVDEHQWDKNSPIMVYPNPTQQEFVVSSATEGIERIEVYSLSGQLQKEVKLNNVNQYNINPGNSGIYILRVHTKSNVFTNKVIKL